MTDFNNNGKFVLQTPKTYTVSELRDTQQVKHSALSVAARSKVVQRYGSNYLSENQGGYGPCSSCKDYEGGYFRKFHLRIELHSGGLLNTGVIKVHTGTDVYSTEEAAEEAISIIAGTKG
jgi:hypothetical protein